MKKFSQLIEKKLKKDKDDPCWKDYVQVGMKKKGDKEVPNCVPKEEVELDEYYDDAYDTGAEEEVVMGLRQLYFIQYAAEEIMDYLEMRGDMDEWFQNKLSNVHQMIQGLHSYIEGDKRMQGFGEEVEQVEEGRYRGERTPTRKAQPGAKTLKQMAADMKAAADKKRAMNAEEVEQVDELKKSTLQSYMKKSASKPSTGNWDKTDKGRMRAGERIDGKFTHKGSKHDPKTGEVIPSKYKAEEVELSEKYEVVTVKTIDDAGEDKALSYGRKKGYKEAGVIGDSPIKAMVLFHLKPEDKKDLKGANIKAGEQVFRYATRSTIAGDIFPLIKVNLDKGMAYYLTQESSAGDIDEVKFETRGAKLKFARMMSGVMEEVELEESEMAGWIAMYGGKKVEIKKGEAKDLYNAKMKAAQMLKVPKSKMGLLAIKPAYNEEVELDESKVPAGMKFMDGLVYKGTKHTYYRKGNKMTDPVVVHIDGKEWKEFGSLPKAKAAALAHIKSMKESFDLKEKAVSQAQQKMMGMALAYKRGEMDDASPEVKKMADSMSEKDLEDFAKTKHKGLPVKKEAYLSAAYKKMKEAKKKY